MYIVCPSCSRRYVVSDSDFLNATSSKVRCVGCEHVWTHKNILPPSTDSTPKLQVDPTMAPMIVKTRSWKILFGWALWFALVGGLLAGGLTYRETLVECWPPISRIEALIQGHQEASHLRIHELGHYIHVGAAGRELIVTGVIENKTQVTTQIPPLFVTVGIPGQDETGWAVPISEDVLAPGGRLFFESPSLPVLPKGTKVYLSFGAPFSVY